MLPNIIDLMISLHSIFKQIIPMSRANIISIPNTINISFDNVDAEAFFVATKEYYAVSNGAACVSGSYEPSYVLNAMGLDKKRISNAIRLSWDYDTQVDFNYLVSFIKGEQEEE